MNVKKLELLADRVADFFSYPMDKVIVLIIIAEPIVTAWTGEL